MEKKTKHEKKLNRKKNIVYSSYYSTVSFIISFALLVADYFFDGKLLSNIAVMLFILLILTCGIGIKKLRKELEANNPKAKKYQEFLSKAAMEVSYLSYPLLAFSLLLAIVANL